MALLLAKIAKIIFEGESADQFSLPTQGQERATLSLDASGANRAATVLHYQPRVLALDRLSDAPGFQRVHSRHPTFHILWFL